MENIKNISTEKSQLIFVNSEEIKDITPPSLSNTYSTKIETSHLNIKENININNEKEIKKLNIFNIKEEDEDEKEENPNKINIIEKGDNYNLKESINILKRGSMIDNLKLRKLKNFRFSGYISGHYMQRKTLLPKKIVNDFKNKNINNNLRKTILEGSDINRMRRVSITNFYQSNNLNKNKQNININNFVHYEDMFLDDEIYLRAPGSFPDEEEKNYLLKLNFLEENDYLETDNINNEYVDRASFQKTKTINFNSKLELNLKNKSLVKNLPFEKIEEDVDIKNINENIKKKRLTKEINELKNIFIDEEEELGKNIELPEKIKIKNKDTFEKKLVSFENESNITYISINLFIKKVALYNFRIMYPILYKAFMQQYAIFISIPLFIEKMIQAFQFYYNKYNKISNELVNLLNKVVSENYEKVKNNPDLLQIVKNFYFYLKKNIFTENKSAIDQDVDSIYYILFDPESEDDINYCLRMVLERRKSNSIFIKSKNIYSKIFNRIENNKNKKKKKCLIKTKTDINLNYRYFYIFYHDPMEIAEYLTCISYQMLRNINYKELLNKNFAGKEKEKKAPNVMKIIDRFNKLVFFIIEDIFSYDNKKVRCQCIEKWVDVALKLKELHNYNDLVMINICLVNFTLNKLKLTFKKLSNKYKTIIKEMNAFCSSKDCYINIRRLIFNNKGIPYIPYLGIILKELMNIEEMDYVVNENNINFDKLIKIYNVIYRFNEFKKTKFAYEKSKELDILINLKPKTEEELDEMVLQIEPKLKVFASRGNKKRLTNTDKFYYKINEKII